MKQKDLAIIVGAAVLSGIVAFVLSSKIVVTPAHRQQQVEVVQAIDTQFNQPDSTYFNAKSIDPTELIQIGNNSTTAPFNNATQ